MKEFNLEFNLELAKAGHPVQTRDGKKVRIVCWDAKYDHYPIIALVENPDGGEHPDFYTTDGHYTYDEDGSELDLVMAPEKHEGWVNIYHREDGTIIIGRHHKTKEDAEKDAEKDAEANIEFCDNGYIDTVKIEWEE